MLLTKIDSKAFPIGSTVTLKELSGNPYPIYRRLQSQEPVSWIEETQMWFITRREDVLTILADPETFTVNSPHSPIQDTFGTTMITTDGPEQYRLRQPFMPPFLPRALRRSAPAMIERITNRLIDAFIDAGEVDLAWEFSDKLSLYTVTGVLGLPIEDFARFRGWYDNFAVALGNFLGDAEIRTRGHTAFSEFSAFVASHLERLASEPDDSILSLMMNDTSHDLSETEIVSAAALIIFGGLETTAAMFSNTIWALLNHPDQFEAVLQNHDLLNPAIEEALRWESPVQTCTRHVTQLVTIRGVRLEPGQTLQCILGAANRDPAYFTEPDPDIFDIRRSNADQHLAFARGKHYCIGAALARLEGEIGLRILFERLPNLRLHPDYASAPQGHEFRSLPTLHVQWG